MKTRAIGVLLASAALTLVPAAPASAASARSNGYRTIVIHEDLFVNYDHTKRRVSRRNVDWAAALVFWNNASINRVKNSGIGPLYDRSGSKMNAVLSDNRRRRRRGLVWDKDGGRKTTKCPGAPLNPSSAKHYRIYADRDDRLYNLSWGYWVWGTTHWDIHECGGGAKRFGYSESAERYLVDEWNKRVGPNAYYDWRSFGNREPYRVEGDHVWDNDGRFSTFRVR